MIAVKPIGHAQFHWQAEQAKHKSGKSFNPLIRVQTFSWNCSISLTSWTGKTQIRKIL